MNIEKKYTILTNNGNSKSSHFERELTSLILSNTQKSLVIANKLKVSKNILETNKLDYLNFKAKMDGDSNGEIPSLDADVLTKNFSGVDLVKLLYKFPEMMAEMTPENLRIVNEYIDSEFQNINASIIKRILEEAVSWVRPFYDEADEKIDQVYKDFANLGSKFIKVGEYFRQNKLQSAKALWLEIYDGKFYEKYDGVTIYDIMPQKLRNEIEEV